MRRDQFDLVARYRGDEAGKLNGNRGTKRFRECSQQLVIALVD